MKKVSIVLPTYNGARYLRDCLDSCFAQTHTNFELIVVDGGSTDNTRQILAEVDDPRLQVIDQPANSGKLPGALNLGFQQSTGEYLTWMQDDDLYDPTAIENLVAYLDAHPDMDFVYSTFYWIDQDGEIIKLSDVGQPEDVRVTNPIGHYYLYRRKVQDTVGWYDFDFYLAEDYEYWVRVFLHHKMARIETPLYRYRMHPGSLTGTSYIRFEALRVSARARKKWFHVSNAETRKDYAHTYIQEAFASHQNHDDAHLRFALVQALRLDPTWIFNRGVLSLFVKKVLLRPRQQKSKAPA